jgi:hypothetical protein
MPTGKDIFDIGKEKLIDSSKQFLIGERSIVVLVGKIQKSYRS